MSKKFELKANDKNLVSTCVGLIITILTEKRAPKHFNSFEATFAAFQERVKISPELWKPVAKGVPKWQQAIRNSAKVHIKKRTPDALTQGELMALVDGGFALPHTVPPGREVVEFPSIGGFKMPKTKKKPRTVDLDLEENRGLRSKKRKRERPLRYDEVFLRVAKLSADDVRRRVNHICNQLRNIIKNLDVRLRDDVVIGISEQIDNGDWVFRFEDD